MSRPIHPPHPRRKTSRLTSTMMSFCSHISSDSAHCAARPVQRLFTGVWKLCCDWSDQILESCERRFDVNCIVIIIIISSLLLHAEGGGETCRIVDAHMHSFLNVIAHFSARVHTQARWILWRSGSIDRERPQAAAISNRRFFYLLLHKLLSSPSKHHRKFCASERGRSFRTRRSFLCC